MNTMLEETLEGEREVKTAQWGQNGTMDRIESWTNSRVVY